MPLYLKKVEAIQFLLTDSQKELIRTNGTVHFENSPVKHIGGEQYIVLLQQGENLIKIHITQWLVRHPDGLWQIFWPDRFVELFIKGSDTETIKIQNDPFTSQTFKNQPNIIS